MDGGRQFHSVDAKVATDAFGNALGSSLAQNNYSGDGQQTSQLSFAQDTANRQASGYWRAQQDSVDDWSSQATVGGDYANSPTSTLSGESSGTGLPTGEAVDLGDGRV